jgi:hydrogenase maturation protein HypF
VTENRIAKRIEIRGMVQGVGFRPFVYQLANRYGIKGGVANTSSGVSIYVEGVTEDIDSFLNDLSEKSPLLAHITEVSVYKESIKHYERFSLSQSISNANSSTLISPDVSVCADCLQELFDPDDRRYKYPFINCTNCGPRYTIIDDMPYDRSNTSMKDFRMCRECQEEYDNPEDRRFHAQPNACDACGPHVSLFDDTPGKIATRDPIKKTADLLKQGHIVAIKGIGGFHLAADAENNDAVACLRRRKKRAEKPFALMSYDIRAIRRYAVVEPIDETLLLSPQRPIVLLTKKSPNSISEEVSPKNNHFGTMLPYTPIHYLLLNFGFSALVMTSGNMSDEPIAIDNEEAFERLSNIADFFLLHNRDIYLRSDDSIVKNTAGFKRFIRRSRGYIPTPVFLKQHVPQILACGAELKNTVCLTKDNMAFLSQHIGDLENAAAYNFFNTTIERMKTILKIEPDILAYDLHPDYLSTRYAMAQQNMEKVPVQHHHAHIVSCIAENMLEGEVIGLSFDGTGYGTDGRIWGGEILVANKREFIRKAHLAYVPMPGSAAAIKEPWRMAISYLYDAFGNSYRDLELSVLKEIDEKNINIISEMISKNINSPSTSSLGRLFDGIASIIGLRHNVCYEGQAAMELEMIAGEETKETYEYEWTSGDVKKILLRPIICGIVHDMINGVSLSRISTKCHITLIQLFVDLCDNIRAETDLNRIVLSGGVFQNSILLSGLKHLLEKHNFQVFTHCLVPTNDGGISLGQAIIAASVSRN